MDIKIIQMTKKIVEIKYEAFISSNEKKQFK